MTSAKYLRQLKSLMPRGRFLLFDGVFGAVLQVWADELLRLEERTADGVLERRPATASETLEEWEDQYGLPSTGSTDERWARVDSKRRKKRRTRPVDYQERFAPVLDVSSSDIMVIERGRAFAIAVGDDREIYRFFLYRDPTLPGSYVWQDAQALLDDYVQSHTKGHIIESLIFRCDDPYSLTDRDLLDGDSLLPAVELLLTEEGSTLTTEGGDPLEL